MCLNVQFILVPYQAHGDMVKWLFLLFVEVNGDSKVSELFMHLM